MPQTKYFTTKGASVNGQIFLKQKKTNFYFLVSPFKGRGTQSQFLETFYEFMEILHN